MNRSHGKHGLPSLKLLSAFIAVVAAGCGGGGGSDTAPTAGPAGPAALPPSTSPVTTNSYASYKQIGLLPQNLPFGDNSVRAYADFTGHGRLDLFRAVLTYDPSLPIAQATPSRFEFYGKQADGSFTLNTVAMPPSDGCLHPRKAIVADFNNDGRPDVFVACHGYDAAPFPGERSKVVLSRSDGTYTVSDASSDIGFNHSASAMDLNGDGRVDVVVANNADADRLYTLLNDGTGHFVRESPSRLPAALRNGGNYFSVELVDVNEDGKLDLLVGGHEFEGGTTALFLNPGSNNFAAVAPTVIPAVANEGVVLDFTVTGTGSSRSLWLLRTSGGDGTFYQSRVIQKVAYPSMASTTVLNQRPAAWIPWLIPAVVGGVPVVTSDNLADAVSVTQ
jgi:hypothetical protein